MFLELLHFYVPALFLLFSALGIIFSPRMYLSLVSFFLFVVMSSLIFFDLNAKFIAVFQFILCGVCLVSYLFLLLKKMGRLNLELKLVSNSKIIWRVTVLSVFVLLGVFLLYEEFVNSLFSIFNTVAIKSFDVIDFSQNIFPLHLIVLLFILCAVVIRVFLISVQTPNVLQTEEMFEENEIDD